MVWLIRFVPVGHENNKLINELEQSYKIWRAQKKDCVRLQLRYDKEK